MTLTIFLSELLNDRQNSVRGAMIKMPKVNMIDKAISEREKKSVAPAISVEYIDHKIESAEYSRCLPSSVASSGSKNSRLVTRRSILAPRVSKHNMARKYGAASIGYLGIKAKTRSAPI